MWRIQSEELPHAIRCQVEHQGQPATMDRILAAWSDDPAFREWFGQYLAAAPYSAFRWETPAVTRTNLDRPFEFVLIDSPRLERSVDQKTFAEHFHDSGPPVVTITNLGGDAVLVIPAPRAEPTAYGHLASFVRRAPRDQQQALWQAVAQAMRQRISDKPVWLSTAGGGVAWLHVRLDDRPKYYHHRAYARLPA